MRVRLPRQPAALSLLAAAATLLFGCAAAKSGTSGAEAGHLHEYEVQAGQHLRYGSTMEMQMTGEGPMPLDMGMTIGVTVAMDILSTGSGGFEGEVEIEEISIGGEMGQAMGSLMGSGAFDELKGVRSAFAVDPNGRIEDALSRGEVSTDIFSNMSQLSRMIFIPWPDWPVEAGATWHDSLAVGMNQMGIDVQSKTLDDLTYEGIQAVDLDGVLTEVHVVRKRSQTVASGGGDIEQMSMDMVITGSTEATFYFDTRSGLLIEGKSRDTILSEMTMSIPAEMTMLIQIDNKTTIKRMPQ